MAYKNISPDQERELSDALGPEFNAQQQQRLMNFADALLAKPVAKAQAAKTEAPAKEAPAKEAPAPSAKSKSK